MKKQFIKLLVLSMFVGVILSCTKSDFFDNTKNEIAPKEVITIKNIGEAHNYLLDKYRNGLKTKSITEKATFGDVYKEMERLFNECDKYSAETGSSVKSISTELLESLNTLPLDSNFPVAVKKIFKKYIESSNLNQEIIDVLLKSTENFNAIDLTSVDTSLISTYESDLVYIYNDVYKSSFNYWSDNNTTIPGVKRSATNTEIIWSDAAGAVLGAACGGVMSILMGASFSHCMERCVQMSEE